MLDKRALNFGFRLVLQIVRLLRQNSEPRKRSHLELQPDS
jgi:hypothetical protein